MEFEFQLDQTAGFAVKCHWVPNIFLIGCFCHAETGFGFSSSSSSFRGCLEFWIIFIHWANYSYGERLLPSWATCFWILLNSVSLASYFWYIGKQYRPRWDAAQYTIMILSFRTDMPGQTVQTQIRMFLEEQSDQGLHCLPFRLHRLDSLLYGRAT